MKQWRHSKAILLLYIFSLIILGFLAYKFLFSEPGYLRSLPNLELTNIDSRVANKIRDLRQAVERKPNSAQLWGRLAMILDIHDFKQEAIPCYKQAAKLDPDEFSWCYYGAITLNHLGDPGAFEWFDRAISLKPKYIPTYIRYGQALFNAGHLQRSKELFKHAITIAQSPHAYLGLGKIALTEGDLSSSRKYVQKALEIAPKYREAHGVLAEVLRRLGHTEEAAEQLHIAQELPKITQLEDPIYEELIAQGLSPFWYGERARRFKRKGLLNEAIGEIEIALQLSPNPKGHNYLGTLLQQTKKFDEAAKHYRKAIVLNPNYYEAIINLGRLLLQTNQIEDALFWADKALRLNPGSPEPYTLLGDVYLRSSREADAIRTFRNGLEYTSGSVPLAQRLAWLLATSSQAGLRNGTQAVKLAETACEKTTFQNAEVLDVLAAAYAETGQFENAVKIAEKAHRLALTDKQSDLANQIQSRLDLYLSRKPYRRKDRY